jgi:membrane protease YdiL (CAAX protease family)
MVRPAPLVSDLTLASAWWPCLIFAWTGVLEEVLFRGILQSVAQARLGGLGLVFVSALSGLLQISSQGAAAALLVFALSLVFSWAVGRTRSVLGVGIAHGLANVGLFVILPTFAQP